MNYKNDLFDRHPPDDFVKRLAAMLKVLPYDDRCDTSYRAITSLLVKTSP